MNQETNQSNQKQGIEDGYIIDFGDIFKSLLNQKYKIIFLSLFSAILSVIIALQLPVIYKSSALLNPSSGSESSMNSGLGGLASLAGIRVGSEQTDQVGVALATVNSQEFFKNNLYEEVILDILSTGWDSSTNTLLYETDSFPDSTQIENLPSVQQAFGNFSDMVIVMEQPLTGLVTITAEHYSPHVAKKWIDLIINKINMVMRNKEIQKSSLAIEYFESEMQKTTMQSMQKVFSELLKDQHTKLMLASVNQEYVLEVIEPPVASEKRFKPSRARFCIIFTFIGCMFSLFFGYIYDKSYKFFYQS